MHIFWSAAGAGCLRAIPGTASSDDSFSANRNRGRLDSDTHANHHTDFHTYFATNTYSNTEQHANQHPYPNADARSKPL